MHFSNSCVAVAVLASLSSATAIPHTQHKEEHGFRIEQVKSGNKVFKSGPLAVEKTFQKFGAVVPENVKNAAKIASAAVAEQSGSVVATPEAWDVEYLCPVSVGTPAQTLMLDFDTGSSDLWVFSSKQPKSQISGHSIYNIASSKTAKLSSGSKWNIAYGDGSGAKGIVYTDKVVIGPVTATSQAVEAATSVSSSFVSDTLSDGLVGLASSSINTVSPKKVTTFFDTVKSTLPAQIFTAALKHNAPGTYTFGTLTSSAYTGNITYTPVSFGNGYWEFDATAYTVLNTTYVENLDCIADTGTTLIYIPDDVLTNYYAAVSGAVNSASAGGWIFPCNATLPSWSVTIGGASQTVPGAYINYASYDSASNTCFGSLQSSDGIGLNILGDVFLKSVYAVFDEGNTRIGFAPQAGLVL